MMKKTLFLIAPLAFYFQSTHATETTSPYSANITAASQYVSRGFQQTWGKPALQGGLDYNHANGFYAGTWASTVSDHFIRDASVEWDVYTGYSRSFGDLTVGTKVAYYIQGQKPLRIPAIPVLIMGKLFLKSAMGRSALNMRLPIPKIISAIIPIP
jgi:uncharacterized protein (TIGR02001 family)